MNEGIKKYPEELVVKINSNFTIHLNPSYEKLYASYSRNCKRNIKTG